MRLGFFILFALLITSACNQPHKPASPTVIAIEKDSSKAPLAQNIVNADSSIALFGDTAYKLQLHIFDKGSLDQTKPNAILTVRFNNGNSQKIVLKDSLYCMLHAIDFKDFNNDNVKDVLIYYYGSTHTNKRYHLYLVFPNLHKLVRVKGFEELPNPNLNSENNIITSLRTDDANYYSFYRINQKNGLVDLGHAFETAPEDSIKYRAAIKEIQQENKME